MTNELANKIKEFEEEKDLAKSFMISLVKINPFGKTEVTNSDRDFILKNGEEEGEEIPASNPDIPTTSFIRAAIQTPSTNQAGIRASPSNKGVNSSSNSIP